MSARSLTLRNLKLYVNHMMYGLTNSATLVFPGIATYNNRDVVDRNNHGMITII